MSKSCYICGIEEGTEPMTIYHCDGPQDMLFVSVRYFEDEQYICETCSAALSDIVFYMRHNKPLTSIFKAWKLNKEIRTKEMSDA